MYSILSPTETYAQYEKLIVLTRDNGLMRQWLNERKGIKLSVIVEKNNCIIGWAAVGSHSLSDCDLIASVFINKKFRRQGLGHKLIDTLGAAIAASKYKKLFVLYAFGANKIYKNLEHHIVCCSSPYLRF